ncbi:MAG: CocE/NonD family hydrolase [Candidatus Helarchaeota archaeon]
MTRREKYSFKPTDIHFSNEAPLYMENEKIDHAIDWLITRAVPFMDYIAPPARGLLNSVGRGILQLMGLNKLEGKGIRLKEYPVKMRDGAISPTDVYLPEDVYKRKSKCPTILVRLPYWKNMVALLAYLFAAKGYVCVLQDIRGCASAIPYGTMAFTYLIRQDGMDTLDWITKRFWYNGKVAMWGISFLGVTQLALAWDNEIVTCFNPMQCSYYNMFLAEGGLLYFALEISILRLLLGITQNVNPSLTAMIHGAKGVDERLYFNPLLSLYNDPLDYKYSLDLAELAQVGDIDKLTGLLNETFDINLTPNQQDDGSFAKFLLAGLLGRRVDMSYDYLPYAFGWDQAKMTTPTLAICSWYDIYIEHILEDIKRIQATNPEYFKTKFKLIVGPGSHGGFNLLENFITNGKKLFQLYQNFAPMWWYEHWLKGDGHELSKVPPLRLYVMNRGVWRHFSRWPPKATEMTLYLHSTGNANSLSGDGELLPDSPDSTPPDEYDFDPSNPVPTRGGRFLMLRSGGLNQIPIEKRKDVLIYTTPKLSEGLELIGEVYMTLYASSSAKDTDFMVKLVDVYGKRKAINIIDGGIRARFREGLKNPSLLEPDKVYKYEIKIGSLAWYFKKHHRIRLEVSSSNFPRFNVNSNLAGEQTEKGYLIAHQKIFHDSEFPSHLTLPLFKKD